MRARVRTAGASDNALHTLCVSEWVCVCAHMPVHGHGCAQVFGRCAWGYTRVHTQSSSSVDFSTLLGWQ